jgi:hypothetical protein
MNNAGETPAEIAERVKTDTGYTFSDYIQTMTLMNNKTLPDMKLYQRLKSGGTLTNDKAGIDVFISKKSLENLKNADVEILAANDKNAAKYFQLFALLPYTGGDITAFVSGANEVFGCESV